MKVGSCLGHHEMVEFSILGDERRVVSRTVTWDFQKADFHLFGRLFAESFGRQS